MDLGKNSSEARRARVKLQLRDKHGRWIEMGGGVKWFSSNINKYLFGTVVDQNPDGTAKVEVQGSKTKLQFNISPSQLEVISSKATIPTSDKSSIAPSEYKADLHKTTLDKPIEKDVSVFKEIHSNPANSQQPFGPNYSEVSFDKNGKAEDIFKKGDYVLFNQDGILTKGLVKDFQGGDLLVQKEVSPVWGFGGQNYKVPANKIQGLFTPIHTNIESEKPEPKVGEVTDINQVAQPIDIDPKKTEAVKKLDAAEPSSVVTNYEKKGLLAVHIKTGKGTWANKDDATVSMSSSDLYDQIKDFGANNGNYDLYSPKEWNKHQLIEFMGNMKPGEAVSQNDNVFAKTHTFSWEKLGPDGKIVSMDAAIKALTEGDQAGHKWYSKKDTETLKQELNNPDYEQYNPDQKQVPATQEQPKPEVIPQGKPGQGLTQEEYQKVHEKYAAPDEHYLIGNVITDSDGKQKIIGKNGEKLAFGDKVSYSKKGETKTGTIASFLVNQKSAKVTWDDHSQSYVKGTQLSGLSTQPLAQGKKSVVTPATPSQVEEPKQEVTPNQENDPKGIALNVVGWKKLKSSTGSNPGGEYEAPSGLHYFIKQSKSDLHAQNEVLATDFYHLTGIEVANLELAKVDEQGNLGTVAPMLDVSSESFKQKLKDPAFKQKFQEGWAVDAWLGNWDVVGLAYDNAVVDKKGNPVRVDPGGSLLFRAMGVKKTATEFSNKVTEWDSMRTDPSNSQTYDAFHDMTDQQIINSVAKVSAISDAKIDKLVDLNGFTDVNAVLLKTRLKARRDDLTARAKDLASKNTVPVEQATPEVTQPEVKQEVQPVAPVVPEPKVEEQKVTPQVADSTPGNFYTDPVSNAQKMFGKDQLGIGINDNVTYSKKGETKQGKVLSFLVNQNSAKVQWADGTHSYVKGTQLTKANNTQVPTETKPEVPQPQQESTPNFNPADYEGKPFPKSGLKAVDLPIGTELHYSNGSITTKKDTNSWTTKNSNGNDLGISQSNEEIDNEDIASTLHFPSLVSKETITPLQTKEINKEPFDWNSLTGQLWSQDIKFSAADMPIGTTLKNTSNGNYIDKISDNDWVVVFPSGGHGGHIENQMIDERKDWKPESQYTINMFNAEVSNQPQIIDLSQYDGQSWADSDISAKDLPIGTEIVNLQGYTWEKTGENTWSYIYPDGTVVKSNYTDKKVDDIKEFSTSLITLPKENNEQLAQPEQVKETSTDFSNIDGKYWKDASNIKAEDFPVGTRLDNQGADVYYIKTANDLWSAYDNADDELLSPDFNDKYIDKYQGSDNYILINLPDSSQESQQEPTSSTTDLEGFQPWSHDDVNPEDMPIGSELKSSKVQAENFHYTKTAPDTWEITWKDKKYTYTNSELSILKSMDYLYKPGTATDTNEFKPWTSDSIDAKDMPIGSQIQLNNGTSLYTKNGPNDWVIISKFSGKPHSWKDKDLNETKGNTNWSYKLGNGTVPSTEDPKAQDTQEFITKDFDENAPSADEMPVGSYISAAGKKLLTKTSDGWIQEANGLESYPAIVENVKGVQNASGYVYTYSVPANTEPKVEEGQKTSDPKAVFWTEDGPSAESLPLGTTVTWTNPNNSSQKSVYTKVDTDVWEANTGSNFSDLDMNVYAKGKKLGDKYFNEIKVPDSAEVTTQPVTKPFDSSSPSANSFPVGTKLVGKYSNITKTGFNTWESSTGYIYTNTEINGVKHNKNDDGTQGWTYKLGDGTNTKSFDWSTSATDAADLPIGVTITNTPDLPETGATFTKTANNTWTPQGIHEGMSNKTDNLIDSFKTSTMNKYTIIMPKNSQPGYNESTMETQTSPETTKLSEPELFKTSVYASPADLPVGSVLSGGVNSSYKKEAPNTWVKYYKSDNTKADIPAAQDQHMAFMKTSNTVKVQVPLNVTKPQSSDPLEETINPLESLGSVEEFTPEVGSVLSNHNYKDFVGFPVGTQLGYYIGNTLAGTYQKTPGNTWRYQQASSSKPSNNTDKNLSFKDLLDNYPEEAAKLKVVGFNKPIEEVEAESATLVPEKQYIFEHVKPTLDELNEYPIGTVITEDHHPWSYSSFAVWEKISASQWQHYNKTASTMPAKNKLTTESLAGTVKWMPVSVSTPKGPDFVMLGSGEIAYVGDNIHTSTVGQLAIIEKINKSYISVKLADGTSQKFQAKKSYLDKNYGKKIANQAVFTDNKFDYNTKSPVASFIATKKEEKEAAEFLNNFAGASGKDYDAQGLSLKVSKNAFKIKDSGLTVVEQGKVDTTHPLYGKPEPVMPESLNDYPSFDEAVVSGLPKWDSADWLAKVEERYLANPSKKFDSVQKSTQWAKIQKVLEGSDGYSGYLDNLLSNKYIDDALYKQAHDAIEAQAKANKPLIKAHNENIAKEKADYEANKAIYFAEYEQKLADYTKQYAEWSKVNAVGSANAKKLPNIPALVNNPFTGGDADWSKSYPGTHSVQSIMDSMRNDIILGKFGLTAAIDSDKIEETAVDFNLIKDETGETKFEVRFKVTNAFGNLLASNLALKPDVIKTSGIYYAKKTNIMNSQDELPKLNGKPEQKFVNDGYRYVFNDETTGAKVVFQHLNNGKDANVSINQNSVQFIMNPDSKPEHLQAMLENLGIDAKPSTAGTMRVIAENKLITLMSGKNNLGGIKNLSGEDRKKALDKVKKDFNVTADDVVVETDAVGKIKFYLSNEKADELSSKMKSKSFVHNIYSGDDVDVWESMLSGPNMGILSNYHRGQNGIGVLKSGTGMSPDADMGHGSGDGIFVHVTPSKMPTSAEYANQAWINPKTMFRRLDYWGNSGDNYGKKNANAQTPWQLMKDYGSLHEVMPHDSVPISDLAFVTIASESVRQEVLKRLKNKGILLINGLPLEQFILGAGMETPKNPLIINTMGTDLVDPGTLPLTAPESVAPSAEGTII